MKKIITTAFVAIAALGLAACDKAVDNSATALNETELTSNETNFDTNEVAADEVLSNDTALDGNEATDADTTNVTEAANAN